MNILRAIIISIMLFTCCGVNEAGVNGTAGGAGNAWGYLPYYAALTSGGISRALDEYDIISASGFFLMADGTIDRKKEAFIDSVHKQCVEAGRIFYPMITFSGVSAGKKILSSDQLTDTAARAISVLASKKKYRGIHLDLEYIPASYKHRLASLLEKIRKTNSSIRITFALYPQVDWPGEHYGFHDITLLHKYIDEAVVMCYDLHNQNTGPGPVTDLNLAEKNIRYILKFMKPDMVRLGIPAYGYAWHGKNRVKAVSARQGAVLAGRYGFIRTTSGTVLIKYGSNSENCAYISDRHTRVEMKKLAAKYKLAGLAVWRIGFEDY